MIPAKEVVARAIEFAGNMLGSSPPDLRLEEVELGKPGPNDVWMITLSMSGRTMLEPLGSREYKVFTVRQDTNLLLLYLVGRTNKNRISSERKRTQLKISICYPRTGRFSFLIRQHDRMFSRTL